MTDTSNEATNSAWVKDACELFDQHAQELGWQRHIYSDNLRALLSERDALRAQLQAARDEALEEAATRCDQERKYHIAEREESMAFDCVARDQYHRGATMACFSLSQIFRALKSTSGKEEGALTSDSHINEMAMVMFNEWVRVDPDSNVAKNPASYMANFADMARVVDCAYRAALKSTSAEGEGCQVCEGSGSVSTTDIDHNGEHIEASCPNCKDTPQ